MAKLGFLKRFRDSGDGILVMLTRKGEQRIIQCRER
jgi:hypothetical protein